jgi:hypothetical protein
MNALKHLIAIQFIFALFFVGTNSAFALTLSPVKVEVTGNPGQTLRGELEMLNEQNFPKTYFSTFENFEPSGDTGSPRFIGAEDGLATWMQTEPSVTVTSGQTIKIPYTITIPPNADPGGYFAAIFWGEDNPAAKQAGEVAIGGKLGALILLRVAGDIPEAAGIQEYGIVNGKKFFSNPPIAFSYRFKNEGGDRVVPLGNIVIANLFGSTVATVKANETEGSVLPNSIRKFTTSWGAIVKDAPAKSFFETVKDQAFDFHLGYYKANLSLTYGTTNKVAENSLWFVIIPWQLLLVCLLALAGLYGIIRVYTMWIIAKSKSQA